MRGIFKLSGPKDLIQFRRMTVIATIVALITGFLLATQLRVQQNVAENLSSESKQNLGEIIRDLDFEVRALAKEERDLELRLLKYEDSRADNNVILEEAAANLKSLKKFVGSVDVYGSGIEIDIEDKLSVLNSYDLAELVNEIKSGSSEAIAINDIRIVASTAFADDLDGGILIGGKMTSAPFHVEAIGDQETLLQVVGMLGGIKYTFNSYEGVTFEAHKRAEIAIPSIKG
ncbi:MAG: DUF881 domain-containing protein [Actinomycetota bacterium]|nr:DUF881 domain-containing protein [Actinomycetota bacterium]